MFPEEFIDKVKDNVDLVSLVEEYTPLKKCGPYTYQGHCPNPEHNDSSPSFRVFKKGYVNGKKINSYDTWACMGCHNGKKSEKFKVYGSDCIAFIQWIEKLKWREAVIFLAEKYYIPIPTEENTEKFIKNKKLAESYMHSLIGKSYNYIKSRGLEDEDIIEWQIGSIGHKIVFPLFDKYKNIIGFSNRWIEVPEGRNDKYKNSSTSEIFNKSMYLYGIHKLDEELDEIRITEGPLDVILSSKYGAKNVVATLGTAFTENHVKLIKHYKKTPVFCMDGDAAGLKSIRKSIDLLAKEGVYSKILLIPNELDLCDLSLKLKDGIEDYINKNSITYGDFLMQDIFKRYNSKINEVKLKFIPEICEVLKVIPSEDEKMVIKGYIKNVLKIDI